METMTLEQVHEGIAWLDAKYRRHGEEDDKRCADMLREYAAHLARQSDGVSESYISEEVKADLLACDWQEGDLFSVHDEPGEHDPCYLVMPDGASLALCHHADNGVDQARAQFIADCCNQVLSPIQAPKTGPIETASRVFFDNYYKDSEWLKIHPSQYAQLFEAMRAALTAVWNNRPAQEKV